MLYTSPTFCSPAAALPVLSRIGRVEGCVSPSFTFWMRCRSERPALKFGNTSSVILAAIQSANDSLSHRSSHHAMVTRSPNHMCASSWHVTLAFERRCATVALAASSNRMSSRNVMRPGFSMAPYANSGTAIRSSFSNGYGMPNQRSSPATNLGVISTVVPARCFWPWQVTTRAGTFMPGIGVYSNGPTAIASR